MNILGLNFGHDSACTLLKKGAVVAACEEERYNKEKHTRAFPINAINDCLKIGRLKIKDIDVISVGFLPKKYVEEFYFKQILNDKKKINLIKDGFSRIKFTLDLEDRIRTNLGFRKKIEFHNHHYCHLASTFYPSGFKKSLILSLDGMGEFETGMVGIGKEKKIKVLNDKIKFPNSLGLIYAAITYFLGWKSFYDEGIVMGLAPLGNCKEKIKNQSKTYLEVFREIIVKKKGLEYEINKEWITYHYERDSWLSNKFYRTFGKKRKVNGNISQHYKNIASALQIRIEEIVISQLKYLNKIYKVDKLCIAGGVGLNCSLNGKIHEKNIFKKIFIVPASGDSGVSFGASLVAYFKRKKKNYINRNFYLGSRYNDTEIKKELYKNKNKLNYRYDYNISKTSAKIISKEKILGWFQGPAEFGPRALGNRSILCKPFPEEMKNYVNKNVKFRESFRPFAPAILNDKAKEFFRLNQESEHMLIAAKVRKNKKYLIPATVHVDNSSRVQTVSKKNNPKFYNLIKYFYSITNVPVVLNTSFNIKGQPIVNNPKDAISCFLKYNIDYLAIGNFIVEKKLK